MLEILGILPINNSSSVPIDQKIIISFNEEIDPFTIQSGVALFTDSDGLWTGPGLGILDTKYKDVLDTASDYTYFPYNFTIEGNILTIIPQISLLPNRKFYLAIYPGSDISRYISTKTVSDPEYGRNSTSLGIIEITSAYSGNDNDIVTLSFTSENTADVTLQSGAYLGEFIFQESIPVNIGPIFLSRVGNFEAGDTVSIDLFRASGLTSIYQTSFTTNAYSTFVPTSKRIENLSDIQDINNSLKIVSTIPEDLSVNNQNCNPITIKFNKAISDKDIDQNIRVSRTNLNTNRRKQIKFFYKINGDTIKLYLIN